MIETLQEIKQRYSNETVFNNAIAFTVRSRIENIPLAGSNINY